jgi:hypothetical protein
VFGLLVVAVGTLNPLHTAVVEGASTCGSAREVRVCVIASRCAVWGCEL